MKKLLIISILCTTVVCSYGQLLLDCDTTFFHCSDIFHDIMSYNGIYAKQKKDNTRWAMVLKNVFPVDKENLLHFTYVLRTDSTVNMQNVKKSCEDWYGIAFSSKQVAIKEQADDYILGTGQFNMIGQTTIPAVFYYKIIKVHAQIDVIMRFKENRIKLDIIGRHYQYISGDSSGRSHNDLIIPGTVFPFVEEEKSSNKEVYAQSYINFCNNSLSLSCNLLDYINKNIHSTITQEDDNW